MIAILNSMVLGFNWMKELYAEDLEFLPIIDKCKHGVHGAYSIHDGFLFKGNKLCVPKSSFRELSVQEEHIRGLAGHFGINKTLEILQEHLYWSKMNGDVHAIISKCSTCQRSKSHFHQGLCSLLSVPIQLWEDINMDFIVALQRTQKKKDATVMVVVDRFLKMAHFIPYHKMTMLLTGPGCISRRLFAYMGFLRPCVRLRLQVPKLFLEEPMENAWH